MSLPPQVIRIKRKAADESPVSFLRLQENKRHRSDHFVYQRQEQDDHFGERPAGPQVPVIHTFSPRRKGGPGESSPAAKPASKSHEADQDVNPPTTPSNDNAEPRQYHVSRQDMLRANSQSLKQGRGGVSKKRQAPAVFVERKIKQVSAKKLERIRSRGDVRDPSPAPPPFVDTDMDGMDVDPKTPPKKYKKPGIAKFAEDNNEARGAKTEAPAAITDRWRNVDLGQLSAEMNAYTLEQIGLNIKQADEEEQRRRNAAKKQTLASPLKYKPKAPVQRYAERHPDPAPAKTDKEMADKDDNMSDGSDDDDYIIETYVRVPASRIGDHVPPQTVGLLVFDGEPDIEYFYGDTSDSEDEWAEDEEDENAENYYTADYPDDEVASDDEYGYNAYAYRTGNASDLEEYDANSDDDVHHSGGEDNEEGRFKKFKAEYDARKGL